ncbi:MAG: hypothetical protein ACLSVD_09435 [Eggerthellaceae bacterium]
MYVALPGERVDGHASSVRPSGRACA